MTDNINYVKAATTVLNEPVVSDVISRAANVNVTQLLMLPNYFLH